MFVSRLESVLSLALFTSAAVACKDAPTGWSLMGCYVDSGATHLLSQSISFADQPDVTWEKCAASCSGSMYFGIEAGYTCYCGSTITGSAVQAPANDCNHLCSGDSSEWCGGTQRIDLFARNGTLPSSSSALPVSSAAPSIASVVPSSAPAVVSSAPAVVSSAAPAVISSTPVVVAAVSSAPKASASVVPVASPSIAPAVSSKPAVAASSPAAVAASSKPAVAASSPAAVAASSKPAAVASSPAAAAAAVAASSKPASASPAAPAKSSTPAVANVRPSSSTSKSSSTQSSSTKSSSTKSSSKNSQAQAQTPAKAASGSTYTPPTSTQLSSMMTTILNWLRGLGFNV